MDIYIEINILAFLDVVKKILNNILSLCMDFKPILNSGTIICQKWYLNWVSCLNLKYTTKVSFLAQQREFPFSSFEKKYW